MKCILSSNKCIQYSDFLIISKTLKRPDCNDHENHESVVTQ